MNKCNITLPSQLLSPFIKYYWVFTIDKQGNRTKSNVPCGSIEVVIQRTVSIKQNDEVLPKSYICGQYLSPVELTSTGTMDVITIVFLPYGAKTFFSFSLDSINNQRIDIKKIPDEGWQELCRMIEEEYDDETAIRLIEKFLESRLPNQNKLNYNRMKKAVEIISANSEISIKELADLLCLSYRQFIRVFKNYIGIQPVEFSKVIRFQRYLDHLHLNIYHKNWENALDSGYYDQSHLLKDFKLFTGYTVNNYIKINCPYSQYYGHHCIFQNNTSDTASIDNYIHICSLKKN